MNFIRAIGIRVAGTRVTLLLPTNSNPNRSHTKTPTHKSLNHRMKEVSTEGVGELSPGWSVAESWVSKGSKDGLNRRPQSSQRLLADKESSFITFVNFAAFCSNDFSPSVYTLCFLRLLLFKIFCDLCLSLFKLLFASFCYGFPSRELCFRPPQNSPDQPGIMVRPMPARILVPLSLCCFGEPVQMKQ